MQYDVGEHNERCFDAMNDKKANRLPALLLPVIFVCCFMLWALQTPRLPRIPIESETGVFDLRGFDFADGTAEMTRTVEYIPGEFLTPEQFAARDDIIVGRVPHDTRVCTMRARLLAPDGRMYGIFGYSMNYASSVYINGDWLFDEGKPGLTPETEMATESYRLFSATPKDGVIEIVIQTSSFANIDTNSGMEWHIADYENAREHYTRFIAVDIVVIAVYTVLAVIAFLLFLSLPSYHANGWLALLALVYAVRSGLKNTKILLTLFSGFDWPVIYKTEHIANPISVILLTMILHSVFPGTLPKWLRYSAVGIGGAWALAWLVLPWQTFQGSSSVSLRVVFAVLGVLFVFILIPIIRRRMRPEFPQAIVLTGVGLSLFAFAWDSGYFAQFSPSRTIPFNLPFAITSPTFIVFCLYMLVAAVLSTLQKTTEQELLLAQKLATRELELAESRTAIMLSQIQPHFLINTLINIETLCGIEGAARAKKVTRDYSDYLKWNLESLTKKGLISFEEELKHTQTFLDISLVRFHNKLKVEYDIKAPPQGTVCRASGP